MRKWRLLGISLALCGGLAGEASAHGFHYEIDVSSQLAEDAGGKLSGLRMHWLYDPSVSAVMLEDEDTSPAHRAASLQELSARMLSDLRKYGYFTRLSLNGQALPAAGVSDYHLDLLPDKRLKLDFLLPLAKSQSLAGKRLDINLADPAGTGILLYKSAQDVSTGPTQADCAITLEAHPNYADGTPAQTAHLQCR